jgi:K+/H+ antiporter YhaU regulatory subunit KhtT
MGLTHGQAPEKPPTIWSSASSGASARSPRSTPVEERFRQDWVTFKADDQKRWTNYTLTQEEQRGEILRNFEKISEQVAQLGDLLQEMEDEIQQSTEQTEKRLQGLLALAHEWVAEYERVEGRAR